jgi:hypothetical protein
MDTELAAMPIIDIDTHYTEPRDMWTSRAPQKLRDLVPHVVESQEGNEQWVVGDLVLGPPREHHGPAGGTLRGDLTSRGGTRVENPSEIPQKRKKRKFLVRMFAKSFPGSAFNAQSL